MPVFTASPLLDLQNGSLFHFYSESQTITSEVAKSKDASDNNVEQQKNQLPQQLHHNARTVRPIGSDNHNVAKNTHVNKNPVKIVAQLKNHQKTEKVAKTVDQQNNQSSHNAPSKNAYKTVDKKINETLSKESISNDKALKLSSNNKVNKSIEKAVQKVVKSVNEFFVSPAAIPDKSWPKVKLKKWKELIGYLNLNEVNVSMDI